MTLEILLFSLKISLKGHLSNRMDKYHFRKVKPLCVCGAQNVSFNLV